MSGADKPTRIREILWTGEEFPECDRPKRFRIFAASKTIRCEGCGATSAYPMPDDQVQRWHDRHQNCLQHAANMHSM